MDPKFDPSLAGQAVTLSPEEMQKHFIALVKMPHAQDRSKLTDFDVGCIMTRAAETLSHYREAVLAKDFEAESQLRDVLTAQLARGLDLM